MAICQECFDGVPAGLDGPCGLFQLSDSMILYIRFAISIVSGMEGLGTYPRQTPLSYCTLHIPLCVATHFSSSLIFSPNSATGLHLLHDILQSLCQLVASICTTSKCAQAWNVQQLSITLCVFFLFYFLIYRIFRSIRRTFP